MTSNDKIALPSLTVIITVRIDSPGRKRNLSLLLRYLRNHFIDLEIIIVEQARESEITDIVAHQAEVLHVRLSLPECFYKTRNLNYGASIASRENILVLDSDVILDPAAISQAYARLILGNASFIYPYNGLMLQIREEALVPGNVIDTDFIESLPYRELDSSEEPLPSGIEHLYGAPSWPSVGGAFMMNRRSFFACGGYNPNIYSYGFEDGEFDTRLRILGYTPERLSAFNCYHLEHRRGIDSRYNLFADSNRTEAEAVREMTREELLNYIDNGFRRVNLTAREILEITNTPCEYTVRTIIPAGDPMGRTAFVVAATARSLEDIDRIEALLAVLEQCYSEYETVLIEHGGLSLSELYMRPGTIYLKETAPPASGWIERVLHHCDRSQFVFLDASLPIDLEKTKSRIDDSFEEKESNVAWSTISNPLFIVSRASIRSWLVSRVDVEDSTTAGASGEPIDQWLQSCDRSADTTHLPKT